MPVVLARAVVLAWAVGLAQTGAMSEGRPATFVFRDVWRAEAAPERLFAALAAVDDYPGWWPQVRAVERLGPDRGRAVIRSRLPVTLRLVLTREVEDPASGVLRVGIAGDLVGFAEFTVVPDRLPGRGADDATGARADYRQEVEVASRALRLGTQLAPALLRSNHDHMMRGGERGVRELLTRR